ncbi:hypothetical protein CNECB9_2540031 [Cupriavidus necator]|uniref:Uncharacterized protein n=1 Tax=Cupriavidus necator TaxID=106590 RepID=A0A1K0IF16_CUPNE|nr:hypothetical protein CNECB9_2540031 [Cupriavidus necator]
MSRSRLLSRFGQTRGKGSKAVDRAGVCGAESWRRPPQQKGEEIDRTTCGQLAAELVGQQILSNPDLQKLSEQVRIRLLLGLSEILCLGHNMSPRSMYATQDEER